MENTEKNLKIESVEIDKVVIFELTENSIYTVTNDFDGITIFNRYGKQIPDSTSLGGKLYSIAQKIFNEQKKDS
ncbi:MAG: hypothetical protein LBF27_00575 [Sphingobacterium sp.]|jgi:hypothetical protein|nr:hypothetical protein [Sphingobacterium sp.]